MFTTCCSPSTPSFEAWCSVRLRSQPTGVWLTNSHSRRCLRRRPRSSPPELCLVALRSQPQALACLPLLQSPAVPNGWPHWRARTLCGAASSKPSFRMRPRCWSGRSLTGGRGHGACACGPSSAAPPSRRRCTTGSRRMRPKTFCCRHMTPSCGSRLEAPAPCCAAAAKGPAAGAVAAAARAARGALLRRMVRPALHPTPGLLTSSSSSRCSSRPVTCRWGG